MGSVVRNLSSSFSVQAFATAALLAGLWVIQMAPGSGRAEAQTVPGVVSESAIPEAAADQSIEWQRQFSRLFQLRMREASVSVAAVRLTLRSVTRAQLKTDAQQAATFCAQLANEIDIALRTGASPSVIALEASHSQRRGSSVGAGPRGEIDRGFLGRNGAAGAADGTGGFLGGGNGELRNGFPPGPAGRLVTHGGP